MTLRTAFENTQYMLLIRVTVQLDNTELKLHRSTQMP